MKYLSLIVFAFLSSSICASSESNVKVETLTKTTQSWNGDLLPAYHKGQPEITILKITIPPQTTLPWHYHPTINAGVLTKGELTVTTKSGETLLLSVGDTIVELVDKIHTGINKGKAPVEIVVFYAGVVGKPITIKQE